MIVSMKKILLGLVSFSLVSAGLFFSPSQAVAGPAEIKPIDDALVMATTATVKYKNIRAAKKFKFELWDKRTGRAKLTFFLKNEPAKRKNISHLNSPILNQIATIKFAIGRFIWATG